MAALVLDQPWLLMLCQMLIGTGFGVSWAFLSQAVMEAARPGERDAASALLPTLQSGGYAGGSAWMLADMQEKDTATACTDPNKSFALWTGLFAIGGTYCDGGTSSRAAGQPKATAMRVCMAYTGNFSECTVGTPFTVRRYLPSVAR